MPDDAGQDRMPTAPTTPTHRLEPTPPMPGLKCAPAPAHSAANTVCAPIAGTPLQPNGPASYWTAPCATKAWRRRRRTRAHLHRGRPLRIHLTYPFQILMTFTAGRRPAEAGSGRRNPRRRPLTRGFVVARAFPPQHSAPLRAHQGAPLPGHATRRKAPAKQKCVCVCVCRYLPPRAASPPQTPRASNRAGTRR